MRVLAHVHTFNDADVIDETLQALCEQTYPLEEILLVDNASTDGTLDREFPDKVTVIRHDQNLGTSGTVHTGMKYAIEHGFDWIYILDADSVPYKDAIQKLMELYQSAPAELQRQIWWLGSLPMEANHEVVHHGGKFTDRGVEGLSPPAEPPHYECDTNMWTGSCYRLEAVKEIGLPDPNYVLDWGDVIYGYEGMVRGYRGFVLQTSIVLHNLHPVETIHEIRIVTRLAKVFYSAPIRFYYLWRNTTYFWLYHYKHRSIRYTAIPHFFNLFKWLIKASLLLKSPVPIVSACLRGCWDGIGARLDKRF